jgi:hypothetical protein
MTIAPNTLTSKTIILSLTVNTLGNHRKVRDAQVVTSAEKSLYNVTQKLIDAPEFKALGTLEGEIREYVKSKMAGPSPFKNGTYTLPISLMIEVDDQLQAYKLKQWQLLNTFIDALPFIKEKMEQRASDMFDWRSFPTATKVRESFDVQWNWVQLSTPDTISAVDSGIFKREQKKIEQAWAETMADMQDLLRVEMMKLTEAMTERLADDNGKKKIFRDTLVTNFTDFLKTFNARNVTDNHELEVLAQQAASLLQGVDADDLRKSRRLRQNMQKEFTEMKQQLATMVIDRPTRGIELGD